MQYLCFSTKKHLCKVEFVKITSEINFCIRIADPYDGNQIIVRHCSTLPLWSMGRKWLKPGLLKIGISRENCAHTAKGDIKAGLYWCPISLVKHDRWWSRLYRYLSAENWYFIQHLALNQCSEPPEDKKVQETEATTAQRWKISTIRIIRSHSNCICCNNSVDNVVAILIDCCDTVGAGWVKKGQHIKLLVELTNVKSV